MSSVASSSKSFAVLCLQNWAFSDIRSGQVISKGNDPSSPAGMACALGLANGSLWIVLKL